MSILELAICLSLSKSLNAVWPLINTFQFVVFIALWNIKYPKYLRRVLHEMKRIALGEYLDDLELGDKFGGFFGVSESKDDVGDVEKVGEDAEGDSKSFLDNFGVSFILFFIAFALLIAIVLFLVYYVKRAPCS